MRGMGTVMRSTPQYRAASYAYKYGPTAARAAAKIAKWGYRRWKSRRQGGRAAKRRRTEARDKAFLGDTRHTHFQKGSAITSVGAGTLVVSGINVVQRGTDKNEVERGKFIVKGVKLCGILRNLSETHIQYCRWMLVEPRYPGDMSADTITTIPFFSTANVDNGARTASFDTLGGVTAGSPQRLRFCAPMNKGYWRCFAGGKFRLSPNTDQSAAVRSNEKIIDKYIKLRMTVEQPDSTVAGALEITRKLIFLMWVENMDNATGQNVAYEWNFTTHFKQGN